MNTNATLETDLDEIRRLDSLRKQARDMLKKGLRGLRDENREHQFYEPNREGWHPPGDSIEKAIVVNTLLSEHPEPEASSEHPESEASHARKARLQKERKYLARFPLDYLFHARISFEPTPKTSKGGEPGTEDGEEPDLIDDHVPILRSAQALHTLSLLPGFALSPGAINSYFRIAYELNHTSNPHEDLPGGASAGALEIPQTAFMTWWCVRAVLAFADAFEATADLISGFKVATQARPSGVPETWWRIHEQTARLSAIIQLGVSKQNALIPIDAQVAEDKKLDTKQLVEKIISAVKSCPVATNEWPPKIEVLRNSLRERRGEAPVPAESDKKPSTPDQVSKIIAVPAYEAARDRIVKLKDELQPISQADSKKEEVPPISQADSKKEEVPPISQVDSKKDVIDSVVGSLRKSAQAVRETLDPVKKFLRSVLDHELASEFSQPQRVPDCAELLFAADALAQLSEKNEEGKVAAPEDDRALFSSLERVLPLLTSNGRVPSHKPFDVMEKGYVLHVAGAEVIRVFSDLVWRSQFPIASEVVNKLLRHFSETWRGDEVGGWRHERDGSKGKCQWTFSGLSVLALGSVVRMLDARIDQMILKHFSVRMPGKLKLDLDDLFYPDYGLDVAGIRRSVAVEFRRMLAHVRGVKPPGRQGTLCSAILYGPPGTGKTTLVEALAKTAKVPLVEVTPSDIVLAGVEKIEGRARAVFEALSMLSSVVILFDEFDSLFARRREIDPSGNILQFVTPGMLPKLKNLNNNARDQKIVFALATNRIGDLDDAAIREGRFDGKFGLYPPDALSRVGQLRMVLSSIPSTPADGAEDRIKKVVDLSADLPMERLGRPCWFSKPKAVPADADTPCSYVLNGGEADEIPWPSPEKDLPDGPKEDYRRPDHDGEATLNESAYREWMEWKFVHCLDRYVKLKGIDAMIRKAEEWEDKKGTGEKWGAFVKQAFSTDDRAGRARETKRKDWAAACDRLAKDEDPLRGNTAPKRKTK